LNQHSNVKNRYSVALGSKARDFNEIWISAGLPLGAHPSSFPAPASASAINYPAVSRRSADCGPSREHHHLINKLGRIRVKLIVVKQELNRDGRL
jgi:hypothetical protein